MNSYNTKVAESLRNAREQAGMSLRRLARFVGTSHSTLLAYETGKKVPSAALFLKILDATAARVDLRFERRVREADGIDRDEELVAVLALADAFPAKASRHLELPIFGRPAFS